MIELRPNADLNLDSYCVIQTHIKRGCFTDRIRNMPNTVLDAVRFVERVALQIIEVHALCLCLVNMRHDYSV